MRNMYLYSPQTVFHKLLTHKKYTYAVKQTNYCQQKTSILPRADGNGQSLMRHHENRTSGCITVSRDPSLIVKKNSESTHCLMIASLLHNCQCQTYTQKTLSNLKEASVTWIAPCIPERLSSEGVEYGLCPACQTVSSDTTTANKALYQCV